MNCDTSKSLQAALEEELRCDPRVDAEKIAVSSEDRTITLKGAVHSYSEKCCAERIAREIRGVVAVNNQLEVRLTIGNYRTDCGLARLAVDILENHAGLSDPLPRAHVSEGFLTLEGIVTSDAQKRSAESALRDVAGVRGIDNRIVVAPRRSDDSAKEAFEAAVRRRAAIVVQELKVEISGATLSVYGSVESCVEHDSLIELASGRRGIARVEDHVVVRPSALDGNGTWT